MEKYTWSEFKALQSSKKLKVQYKKLTKKYKIWASDGGDKYFTYVLIEGDPAPVDSDQEDFEDNYMPTANAEMTFRTESGKEIMATTKEGTKVSFPSHDYCHPCSWWQNATKVLAETLTDSGDGLTFNFANDNIIDADCCSERDRIYADTLLDANVMHIVSNYKRFYKIQIGGVQTTSGFTMNFVAGTVTFDSDQTGNTVTSDYYYATTSEYKVAPKTGKKIILERAEAQFTDVVPPKMLFEVHVDHPVYGDIVANTRTYITMQDYLNESNSGGNKVEQIRFEAGGSGLYDVFTLFWDYNAPIELTDSAGMYIIVKPMDDNDMPITGKMSTFTFYALSEDE